MVADIGIEKCGLQIATLVVIGDKIKIVKW